MKARKTEYFNLDKLKFDPQNPRLPSTRRNAEDQEVLEYFIIYENIFELIASIGEKGFYEAEPLLVIPDEVDEGKYIVVEGNRRLAALMLLQRPEDAPLKKKTLKGLVDSAIHKPINIPVICYKKKTDLLDYLGYRHITGVQPWDSLAKARYLTQLYEHHQREGKEKTEELYRKVARIIGSRTDYVKKLIRGFNLYEEIQEEGFYQIKGLSEENFSFSLLTTAISYNNIADFVQVKEAKDKWDYNAERLKELTLWIFEKGIDVRDFTTLNKVVDNDNALKVFREGKPLDYARRFTDEPREFFKKAIEDATKLIEDAQGQVSLINNFDISDLNEIIILNRKVIDLHSIMKGRIEEKKLDTI